MWGDGAGRACCAVHALRLPPPTLLRLPPCPQIPTRLNTIPHERSTRQWFYRDLVAGVMAAVGAGETRMVAK